MFIKTFKMKIFFIMNFINTHLFSSKITYHHVDEEDGINDIKIAKSIIQFVKEIILIDFN